jgi:alpha-1,3/alpha-1,6-mannosyltransferase
MLVAALYTICCVPHPDLYFVDQISACVPLLRWFSNVKVVFYCHFPDQLLTERISWLKSIYRYPIDWVEESTTGMADRILVNSHYTGFFFLMFVSNLF